MVDALLNFQSGEKVVQEGSPDDKSANLVKWSFRFFLYITAWISIPTCAFFSYKNPDSWKGLYPKCGGSNQSPVALVEKDMSEDSQLTAFHFINESPQGRMINIGHNILVLYNAGLMIKGGNLGEDFQISSFSFHWGENSTIGSEHTLNGKTYPMEEVDSDNTDFDPITDALGDVRYRGNFAIVNVSLTSIMGSNLTTYFRYKGSWTYPPCEETVLWTLFKEPLTMSATQISKFRNLTAESSSVPMVNNYRPVQPLNLRKVFTQPKPTINSPQTTEPPQSTQPTEPPQSTQPTEPPQTIPSTEPTQSTQSMESPQSTQQTKSPQTIQSTEPPQITQQTEPPQTIQPTEAPQTTQTEKSPQTTQLTKLPQTMQPKNTTKSPQTVQPWKSQQTIQTTEFSQTTRHTQTTQPLQLTQFPHSNRSEHVKSSFLVFFGIGIVLMSYLNF